MRYTALLCLISCLVAAGDKDGHVREQVEVVLHKVTVRLSDKHGAPVKGLTSRDFSLKNHNLPISIEAFQEYDQTTRAELQVDHHLQSSHTQLSSQPQRRQQARSLVFLIDTATMSRRAFDDAKPALIKLIEERIGPKDSVKLCQLETTLSHLTPFTTNKQHMRNALEGLNHYGNFRRQLVTIQNDINERIRARHPPRETNRLIDAKRKLKSDHLKTFMFNAEVMAEMVATREGVKSFFLVSGGGYIDTETNNRFSDFTARLNARDITVHALLLKEKVPRYVQDFARGNNLDLERRTAIPDGSVDVDYNTQNTIMENNFQLETGPFNAAVQTGGAFYKTHNFSRIFEGLQELETRANHFYTLWYKSNHEEQRLKLELVAKKKGWQLCYGKEVQQPKPYIERKGESRLIAFMADLQLASQRNGLACDWGHEIFGNHEDGYQVAVFGGLDPEGQSASSYEIGIALLGADQQILAMRRRQVGGIENDRVFPFFDRLGSDVAPTTLRCTVRDLDTGRLQVRAFDLAPAKQAEPLALTGIVLTDPSQPKPVALYEAEPDGENKGQNHWNPFRFERVTLTPGFHRQVTGDKLDVFFRVEGSQPQEQEVFVSLVADKSPVKVPVEVLASENAAHAGRYIFRFNISELASGTYHLYVKAVDGNGHTVLSQRSFALNDRAVM